MKQKIGDWTEEQFETKLTKIVKDIVDETVEAKIRTIRPPWIDQMLELLDKSAGNYKKVDEAQELVSNRQSEHSDTLEEHDNRLTKLEKIIFKN